MTTKRSRKLSPEPPAAALDVVGDEEDAVASPSKRVRLNVMGGVKKAVAVVNGMLAQRVVTPATKLTGDRELPIESSPSVNEVRRDLFTEERPAPITPSQKQQAEDESEPRAKRKLIFGRLTTEIAVSDNVKQVYGIVRQLTGSLGGNGSHGPIYGELTMGSMQKMINLMKEHTQFDSSSRFIDVGSGIGKPNLHVAQDPGVGFSYGIECEYDRWLLGISCLKGVLDAAVKQSNNPEKEQILHRCMFEHGDIRSAETFDPFTHVYMFSIGFPPSLWIDLAERWNRSSSPYMICYHGPKDIIESYEFNVELVTQTSTSMHGSKEGHMGYIYQRVPMKTMDRQACDPLFAKAWKQTQDDLEPLKKQVDDIINEKMSSGRTRRQRKGRRDS